MITGSFKKSAFVFLLLNQVVVGQINPVLKGSWPGGQRGVPHSIALSGQRALVAGVDFRTDNGSLAVIDVSNPASPEIIKYLDTDGWAANVVALNGYAYIPSYSGLLIFDLNPSVPVFAGAYTNQYMRSMAGAGSHLFGLGTDGNFLVIDVANPTSPRTINVLPGISGTSVAASTNGTVCVAGGQLGFLTIDVAVPSEPRLIGSNAVTSITDLAICGTHAFLARGYAGLSIIDFADPAVPSLVASYSTTGYCSCVSAREREVLLGVDDRLIILDVADPYQPRTIGSVDTEYAGRIAQSGAYAYVLNSAGFHVVDLAESGAPKLISTFATAGDAVDLALVGDYVYVADGPGGLRVIDFSQPEKARLTWSFSDADAFAVTISGDFAYVGGGGGGLYVFSTKQPSAPKLLSSIEPDYGGSRLPGCIVAIGSYLYMAYEGGLRIFDASTPESPRIIGGVGHAATRLARKANLLYLVDGSEDGINGAQELGVQIYDISNKQKPEWINSYVSVGAGGIAMLGDFLYVSDTRSGLLVLDSVDPFYPQLVGRFEAGNLGAGVAVQGNMAFVVSKPSTRFGGLQVLDVSRPVSPRRVGNNPICPEGKAIVASGGRIYVAAGRYGVQVFELQPTFRSIVRKASSIELVWDAFAPTSLQISDNPSGDWKEVPGSSSTNFMVVPMLSREAGFFRLIVP